MRPRDREEQKKIWNIRVQNLKGAQRLSRDKVTQGGGRDASGRDGDRRGF